LDGRELTVTSLFLQRSVAGPDNGTAATSAPTDWFGFFGKGAEGGTLFMARWNASEVQVYRGRIVPAPAPPGTAGKE
jgi:hypothetical protein